MRVVFYLLWAVLLAILQPSLARGMELWGIAPNLFLCFVVLIGFFRGTYEGAVCGAVFGLVFDLLVGRMIGVNALIYLYLGLIAGFLSMQFFSGEKKLAACLGIMMGTLVASVVYALALKATGADVTMVTAIFRIGLPEAVYNSAIGFLLGFPVRWSMKWTRMKQQR